MLCAIYDLKALKMNWMFKSCDLDLSYLRNNNLDDTLVCVGGKISAFFFNDLISCGLRGKNIIVILNSLYCIKLNGNLTHYFSC